LVSTFKQALFEKYQVDRTHIAFEAFVRACRPLVASVCWRYLRRPEDVDDAVQETFLKLAVAARDDLIRGNVESWLTATAYKTSVDLIRRATRERRRRQRRARITPTIQSDPAIDARRRLIEEAVRRRLSDALLQLDDAARELIVARFFRRTPLRVIAVARGVSVATLSRHAAAAVRDLAVVLREMGVTGVDELTLAEQFADPAMLAGYLELSGSDDLRFAPDWRAPFFTAGAAALEPQPSGPYWPGWSRPIRVGALVSYLSSITWGAGYRRARHDVEVQVRTMQHLSDPAFQLIGIVEPGTSGRGPVERALRDYELTGGLIDGTDVASLRTLDVILLGSVFAIDPAVAAAFAAAVRSGVGLLNEWWTGTVGNSGADPNVRDLLLAASDVGACHVEPYCAIGQHVPGTVRAAHALLPGLRAGGKVDVAACGPMYRPAAAARVLIEKDMIVPAAHHRVPGLGGARMPAYVVGELGRGRVVVALVLMLHGDFARNLTVGPREYITELLAWLAAPRRDA
jgi:RNA polymerase sigma factor (sigma-70 family)